MSLIKNPDESNGKVEAFFEEIIGNNLNLTCEFIVVNHFTPAIPYFLDALSKVGKIALFVPKGSHMNEQIVNELLAKEYRILGYAKENFDDCEFQNFFVNGIFNSRKYLQANGKLINLIEKCINPNSNFLFIDVGGYFSYYLEQVRENYGNRFLGIVEDTENGHQKYLKELLRSKENRSEILRNFPVMSVSRSLLKQTEDYNVGKSIVEAADAILRVNAHTITERMGLIAVIGFGTIGKSISNHLRQKHVKQVMIYDIDPIRQLEAVSLGFAIGNKDWLILNSDMIFCATGNQSLNSSNFYSLKNNVFIASCTSNDDEFDLCLRNGTSETHDGKIQTYGHIEQYHHNGKVVNLLHKGNAINFIYNATNGPFIYSVLVSLIVSAIKIIKNDSISIPCDEFAIRELERSSMERIAKIWLKIFDNYTDQIKLD
jgi:adenosylhomocysteinase